MRSGTKSRRPGQLHLDQSVLFLAAVLSALLQDVVQVLKAKKSIALLYALNSTCS
jgi:hypothetical protein